MMNSGLFGNTKRQNKLDSIMVTARKGHLLMRLKFFADSVLLMLQYIPFRTAPPFKMA